MAGRRRWSTTPWVWASRPGRWPCSAMKTRKREPGKMKRFARLLDQLSYQSQRNAKLRLVTDYFATAPDPDRGYALAALTGDLVFRHAKAGLFRDLAAARTDP